VGDINGDGYSDLAVAAFGTTSNTGVIYIFYSSGSTGISSANVSSANRTITGASSNDKFGYSISIEDLNVDGYGDLVSGAQTYNANGNTGRVYIFQSSGSTGISATNVSGSNATITGASGNDFFCVTSLGDFNGDGYPDLAIGSYGYTSASFKGRVYIFHSPGSSGVSSISATAAGANSILTGNSGSDKFGIGLGSY
jgi:hypothetical protein